MKVLLTILGLLNMGNLYGYEIKKKINENSSDYVDAKFGSIYYAIRKSLKSGWIKQKGSEKEEGNPERYVYQITPEGKKYYKKGIRKYFENNDLHFDIDILLLFISSLDNEQKENYIEEKTDLLNSKLSKIKEDIKNLPKSSDKHNIYAYIENHLKAELSWIKSLK